MENHKEKLKFILFVSLVLGIWGLPKTSWAATYYIDSKDGSDANNGASPSTPWKYCPGDAHFNAHYVPDTANGDTFIFKGGVEYQGSIPIANSGGAAGKEMIYRGNTVAGDWGSGKAKINLNATYNQAFTGASQSYIKILNFDIYGPKNPQNSSSAAGGALCPAGQYFVDRWTTGSSVPQCVSYNGSGYPGVIRITGTSSFWTIQDCKIHEVENWQDTCISGAGTSSDSSVFGCDAGYCAHPSAGLPSGTYGIHIEGASPTNRAANITIDNNEIYAIGRYALLAVYVDHLRVTRNDIGGINLDAAHKGWTSQFMALGISDDAVIQYNRVHDMYAYIAVDPANEAVPRCHAGDWMHFWTENAIPMTNVVIDGNWFYTSDTTWKERLNNSVIGQISDVNGIRISNNVITNIATQWGGIFVFGANGQYQAKNIGIYNNTIAQWGIKDLPDTIPAIFICGSPGGGLENCDLSTTKIKNNILLNYGTSAYGYPIFVTGTGLPSIDYNIFHNPNNLAVSYISLNGTVRTLAEWRTYTGGCPTGQDCHTLFIDPELMSVPVSADVTSQGNYSLQSTSPAIHAGTTLSEMFTTDKNGAARPAWDIGAYEYVGGGDKMPPAVPSGLTVK